MQKTCNICGLLTLDGTIENKTKFCKTCGKIVFANKSDESVFLAQQRQIVDSEITQFFPNPAAQPIPTPIVAQRKPISKKLIIGLLVAILLLSGGGGIAYYFLRDMSSSTTVYNSSNTENYVSNEHIPLGSAEAIQLIKDRYYQLTAKKGYNVKKYPYDPYEGKIKSGNEDAGGEIEFIYDAQEVKMIIVESWIGDGGTHEEYCFWDGALFFVFQQGGSTVQLGDNRTQSGSYEKRFYINEGRLILCKEGTKEKACDQNILRDLLKEGKEYRALFPLKVGNVYRSRR